MLHLLFTLMLCLPGLLLAQEIRDVAPVKLAAHTFVIHGPRETPNRLNRGFINNPGFVVTSSGVVVIDPGSSVYSGRMVLRQIRKITDKPITHVLNSHIHGDHWLGNQAFAEAFPNAVIMAHPNMVNEARAGAGQRWVQTMDNLTGGATRGTKAVIPSKTIHEGEGFTVGGLHFQILAPQRAHSGTDVMIHVVEDSVLFTGDNSFYERIGRMDDGTFRGNINACEVAIKLNTEVYVPGHGKSGDISRVKAFQHYLKTVYALVGKYYEQGMTDFEMKPRIVAALKDYQQWNGFADEIGKHINLAMLEYEKAQFE